ncbi:hypothetical protein [Chishuiella sp.]|uniref:hypothetical protein n=1 Tax=Chishuiella sp. TaxID=1969467 RepID=UPI0028B077FC|nr:hypothetical protein [Chishuiella sp.]
MEFIQKLITVKLPQLFLASLFFVLISCTLDMTDYEAEKDRDIPEKTEFKEAISFEKEHYKISIETLNGTFYKGYNEIHLTITDTKTNEFVTNSNINFLPISTNSNSTISSCPHQYELVYDDQNNYYSGYSVFTKITDSENDWNIYINFSIDGETYNINQKIIVNEQENKNLNMTTFTGNDDEQYVIALISPQKPTVSENNLVAGIYKYNQPTEHTTVFPDESQFSYSIVNNYTLKIDPRMPEPSMGNHSSLNNKDLTQQIDLLYHGIANYTMTGNWTLNFILINEKGRIIKGTEVPTDFTPGIEGAKSELFIDILF